jgi:hypothetical protein
MQDRPRDDVTLIDHGEARPDEERNASRAPQEARPLNGVVSRGIHDRSGTEAARQRGERGTRAPRAGADGYLATTVTVADPPWLLFTVILCGFTGHGSWPWYLPMSICGTIPMVSPVAVT